MQSGCVFTRYIATKQLSGPRLRGIWRKVLLIKSALVRPVSTGKANEKNAR